MAVANKLCCVYIGTPEVSPRQRRRSVLAGIMGHDRVEPRTAGGSSSSTELRPYELEDNQLCINWGVIACAIS